MWSRQQLIRRTRQILCDHDYKPTAVGSIANTETCLRCFASRFVFHDEPHTTHHLLLDVKRRLHHRRDLSGMQIESNRIFDVAKPAGTPEGDDV